MRELHDLSPHPRDLPIPVCQPPKKTLVPGQPDRMAKTFGQLERVPSENWAMPSRPIGLTEAHDPPPTTGDDVDKQD